MKIGELPLSVVPEELNVMVTVSQSRGDAGENWAMTFVLTQLVTVTL